MNLLIHNYRVFARIWGGYLPTKLRTQWVGIGNCCFRPPKKRLPERSSHSNSPVVAEISAWYCCAGIWTVRHLFSPPKSV